jgi:anti-anti-sigma regulatory factor
VDGSNYRDVIRQAQGLYQAGARRLLIDLAGVTFMSSAGLVALNSAAALFSGKVAAEPEDGWRAIKGLGEAGTGGQQPNVRLLSPTARILSALQLSGLAQFFHIYTDQAAALAAF